MVKTIITLLALYSILAYSAIALFIFSDPAGDPNGKGIIIMGGLLILFWCVIGGAIMHQNKKRFKAFFERIPLNWQYKFVLFATCFAMMEEVVTVSITNIVPRILNLPMDIVHITASANYFHTIFGHSVIIFVGFFIAWGWLLKRYSFTTFEIFICAGIVGTFGEVLVSGPQTAIAGFWFFVYGLMVYLPAYSIPKNIVLPRPRWYQYPLAIILPILMAIPMSLLASLYRSFFDGVYFPGVF